ncbi:MAG: hypothetical protein DWH81_11670 [Planctomycetota bacterium]|nr:MAG: hypothetical protein DWH81_11670 [Planctomycetota bacterium]
MNKTFALLIRSLRTESRDIKIHLFRAGLASLIVLILYFGHELQRQVTAPGMILFKWMTVANWIFITVSGVTLFAVSISEETEHETLGLLRMANIGPLSLLLGKWLPRMLMAFVLVSVQFPFTLLTVTLGGVSWDQIWATYLMLLAHLVLVGNVGLLASVLKPTSVQACTLALAILLIGRILPFLVLAILYLGAFKGMWGQSVADWYYANVALPINSCTSSGRLFGEILSTSFRGSPWTNQVASNLALGAGLFCISWLIFDRVTMRHIGGSATASRSLISRIMTRKSRVSSTVWDWALGWKDFRQVARGLKFMYLKFGLYALFFAVVVYISRISGENFQDSVRNGAMTLMVVIWFFLLPLEMCLLGGRLFRLEIKDQTWSTLLTLPLSLRELVQSKLGGAVLGLIPTITVLGLSLLPNASEIARELTRDSEGMLMGIAYFFSGVILAAYLSTYFSIVWNWAVPMISAASGIAMAFFGNLVAWIVIMIMLMGASGGDKYLGIMLLLMMITGNLVVAFITHFAIGQQLIAKGAES